MFQLSGFLNLCSPQELFRQRRKPETQGSQAFKAVVVKSETNETSFTTFLRSSVACMAEASIGASETLTPEVRRSTSAGNSWGPIFWRKNLLGTEKWRSERRENPTCLAVQRLLKGAASASASSREALQLPVIPLDFQ